jgi:predicted nucleotidyltransferase
MDTDSIKQVLIDWASTKPLVGRLYIFGSRARKDYRHDSDLDIAIELDLSAANGVDFSGGMATWAFETNEWANELHQCTGFKIDLNQYIEEAAWSNISEALRRSSILVYVKRGLER